MTVTAASAAIKARLAAGARPAPIAARVAAPADRGGRCADCGGTFAFCAGPAACAAIKAARVAPAPYAGPVPPVPSGDRFWRNAAAVAAQTPIAYRGGKAIMAPIDRARLAAGARPAPIAARVAAKIANAGGGAYLAGLTDYPLDVIAVNARKAPRVDAPGSALDDSAWAALAAGR